MKRRTKIILSSLSILTLSGWFFYHSNNALEVSRLTITSERLPKSFDGLKILQVSDLHSKWFGEEQKKLLKAIDAERPDLIFLTGDFVDSRRKDEAPAISLAASLSAKYPTYFVTGNHEVRRGLALLPKLSQDVDILRNENRKLERDGEAIALVGIDDPTTPTEDELLYSERETTDSFLAKANAGIPPETFRILLAHRPEYVDAYSRSGIDLVFSGHAHGGQIRLPGMDGLFSPGQGFMPKYTAGRYTVDRTELVVSRGLGNSLFPLRVFNQPELVVVTLERQDE